MIKYIYFCSVTLIYFQWRSLSPALASAPSCLQIQTSHGLFLGTLGLPRDVYPPSANFNILLFSELS